jgi:SynChlorMet cassette radical SAM/SPASM protein ScmF
MTVMGRNKNQVEDIIKLAESLKCGSVKFNIIQPTERGQKMHESGQALSINEYIESGKKVENDLSKKTNLRLVYHHTLAFKPLNKIIKGDSSTCGIFGILGVISNGYYALCGIGAVIPELIFGDAKKNKLEDVWKNNKVLNQIREGLPKNLKGICGNCIMRDKCLGSCIAQNYYRTKDLFAGFWYCEDAYKEGVFPETRLIKKKD